MSKLSDKLGGTDPRDQAIGDYLQGLSTMMLALELSKSTKYIREVCTRLSKGVEDVKVRAVFIGIAKHSRPRYVIRTNFKNTVETYYKYGIDWRDL